MKTMLITITGMALSLLVSVNTAFSGTAGPGPWEIYHDVDFTEGSQLLLNDFITSGPSTPPWYDVYGLALDDVYLFSDERTPGDASWAGSSDTYGITDDWGGATVGYIGFRKEVNTVEIDWWNIPNFNVNITAFDSLGTVLADFAEAASSTDYIWGTAVIAAEGIHHIEFASTTPGGQATMGIAGLRYDMSPVPVPAAVWLFGSGLLGLIGLRRKSQK